MAQAPDTLTGTITDRASEALTIVIPPFVAAPGTDEAASEARDAVQYDLDFSGLLRLATPPPGWTYKGGSLGPGDFQALGQERPSFLAVAETRMDVGQFVLEARVYDGVRGDLVFGSRYRASAANARQAAHKFADEILEKLFGAKGVGQSKILFVGRVGKEGKEIYLCDYDGENLLKLTSLGKLNMMADVNRAGTKIAFVSFLNIYPEIFVMGRDGVRAKVYGRGEAVNSGPNFSPDGARIAFSSTKDGNAEVFVMNADGGNVTRLTHHGAIDINPVFSPTGNEIAFISDRAGPPQVYMMDAAGGNVRPVAPNIRRADSPAFSPDGKFLAFTASVPGQGWQICVLDLASGQTRIITQGPGNNESPSFSPDGQHIAFSSSRSGSYQVWIANRDGTHARPITKGAGAFTPVWFRQ